MTPSEYGCALIRKDMGRIENRKYAMRSLLNAQEEIQRGEIQPLSALDALDAELADEFRYLYQKQFPIFFVR
ncbi:hypothetical protein [Allorhizobium borbori]|uniref:Uncharacterized protein n=1 Tax=Allorhizobium borbori TaxID=485907 RepID=A0A7W6K0Z8_9HYPH|nr:hypothetical protein [Allorhizobium borbori]MBB4103151.1 hypothetical protein [Allorhizobium borbori]